MHNKIAKIAFALIIATIFSTLIMTSTLISAVSSSPTATVSIEPPSIIDTTLVPGETFVINVSVTDVSDLYTWEIRVYFDINIVNVTDASYPPDHVFAGKTIIPVEPVINQDADGWYISFGCSLIGAAETFTGSGTMCQIEFEVKGVGSCNLQFSRPYGQFTFLLDSNLENIDANLQDGYFSNEPTQYTLSITATAGGTTDPAPGTYDHDENSVVSVLAKPDSGYVFDKWTLDGVEHLENPISINMTQDYTLVAYFVEGIPPTTMLYVDPPEIIDPMLIPPATVDINVTIDDVENMYGYEFKLGYNKEILICIGAVIHPVFGEINYIPNLSIDNTAGIIWINVTYYSLATPITTDSPTALATITFRIIAMGSSVLDLYDTSLVDQTGQPIVHEIGDGFIMTLVRDVAVVNVTTSDNVVYQGSMINITVTVRNEGKQSETFVVNIYHGTTLIGSHTVTDLAPDYTETTFTFEWNTTDAPPCHNYTISAEAPPLPDETDTADNMFEDGYVKIKMLGDVNGDGTINMRDISEAAQAFGAYPGHPRWNPEVDLNSDGVVNMRDLSMIAQLFGKECES